jgi:hypothetical protein
MSELRTSSGAARQLGKVHKINNLGEAGSIRSFKALILSALGREAGLDDVRNWFRRSERHLR